MVNNISIPNTYRHKLLFAHYYFTAYRWLQKKRLIINADFEPKYPHFWKLMLSESGILSQHMQTRSGHIASLVVPKICICLCFFFCIRLDLNTLLCALSGHFASLVVSIGVHTPLHGLSGHFASNVDSKKVPPTYWEFVFFFSNIPPILKLEVGLFSAIFFLNTRSILFA